MRTPRRDRGHARSTNAPAPPGAITDMAAARPGALADLAALTYELLDAHSDTAEMAGELCWDPRWAAHLDYLRSLQRVGREMLARLSAEEGQR
jgi:hypothetical protein